MTSGDRSTPREQRKVVTGLFADLTGSTALAELLDPEEAKLLIEQAVARMIQAVEGYGGLVADVAGDGIFVLFGAPAAHEDDPERALRAALQIVEDVSAYGVEVAEAWGIEPISVRVGVNTGSVVLGQLGTGRRVDYTAIGDPVNVAARLQGLAEPGGVLVGGATHQLAQHIFDWGEPRQLEVRGRSEPVTAYPLRGVRSELGPAFPLPEVHARFVGRDRELRAVADALEALRAGVGGLLFVVGEAGIGKSRLLAELRELVGTDDRSPLWLEGRCASYGDAIPYWPFRDLLRGWLGVGADEHELRVRVALRRRVEERFGNRSPEAYPFLGSLLGLVLEPEASARLAELSPEALQYRTFEVVGELLAALAVGRPVVVALEDLHWADPTSVQLVERLFPLTEDHPLLLAVTFRSERQHPSWEALQLALRTWPHRAKEVLLEALPEEANLQLLRSLVGAGTLPDHLERTLLATAEGNPFYLEELVRSLASAGALVRQDGRWVFDHEVPVEVPPTVERVILARIDRLPSHCRELLVASSVLGREFGLPLLEAVAPGDGDLRTTLHELERLELLREARRWPQPEYQFRHVLIQEVAYGTLLRADRVLLHRRAAEWLELRYQGSEEEVLGLLAHHWLRAEDEERAVVYLMRAGDAARETYSLDEAIEHYRALLPLLERRGERQEMALVLFKLALALHTALRFGEANRAYQEAFGLWIPPAGADRPADASLRISVGVVPDDPDPPRSLFLGNIQLCMALFDRLVEAWPDRTIVPWLAESWEISEDGLRYLFRLRPGLEWSDGNPLTAHDVEYGIKRILDPERPGPSVAIYFVLEGAQDYALGRIPDPRTVGVRALDDRTLEFRLVAPAPYFLSVLNRPDGGPQPRHAIEEHGDGWTDLPRQVVSGPFRRTEHSTERLVLERRPEYWLGRPGNLARVEWIAQPLEESAEPYLRGEIDVVNTRFRHHPGLMEEAPEDAYTAAPAWSAYLTFDHLRPPTSHLALRRALAHAIDRQALEEVVPPNFIVATGGLVPPPLQGHTPAISRFDPEAARGWLAKAEDPGSLSMGAYVAGDEEKVLSSIIGTWEKVLGLEVSFRPFTLEEYVRGERLLDLAPIVLSGWYPGYPDPEYYLRLLLHSESATNQGGFSDPAFDDLVERARHEADARLRLELFHAADRMAVVEQVAVIPLWYARNITMVKPWVHGWWEFGKSWPSLADLTVDSSS